MYGHSGHLGHVTSFISTNFHFLVSESLHTKFSLNRSSSFDKSLFKFSYVNDLGPRPGNDLQ